MRSNFATMAKGAATAFAAMGTAAVAGATAIKFQFDSIADKAKQLANSAQVAGVGFTDFQRQAFAASTVGIEFEKLGDIFKDVRDRIGDFISTGGGPMKDFFEQIAPKVGVTAQQFQKLGGKDALQLYYDSLVKAGVSQEEMVFYLEAMASDVTNLIPLLRDGGKAFDEMGSKASVISDEDIKKLQEYTRAQQELQAAKQTLILAAIDSGVLDSFTKAIQLTAEIVRQMSGAAPAANAMGESVANAMNTTGKAAAIAAGIIASRYAVALGVTAVAAARSFVAAILGAIAGMMAYARVAPVMAGATMAVTGLRAAAMGLLALFGGPWGLAIAGTAAGIYWLYQKTEESKRASVEFTQKLTEAQARTAKVTEVTMQLAHAKGEARAASLANANALMQETKQLIANAKAAAAAARVKLTDKIAENNARMDRQISMQTKTADGMATSGRKSRVYNSGEQQLRANIMEAELTVAELRRQEYELAQMLAGAPGIDYSAPPIGNVPSNGGGGASSAAADARRQALDYLEDLRDTERQLMLTGKALAIYNALKQAGVSGDSELGKEIAKQAGQNFDVEEFAQNQQALRDTRDDYVKMREEIGLNERQLALLNAERQSGTVILSDGTIVVSALSKATRKAINDYYDEKDAIEARNKKLEEAKRLQEEQARAAQQRADDISRVREQIGADLGNIAANAFDSLIMGSEKFGKVFSKTLKDLGSLMLELLVYQPLQTMMAEWAKALSGSLGKWLGQIAGNIVGGVSPVASGTSSGSAPGIMSPDHAHIGKAVGGPVNAGETVRVGERGMELFTPDRSGYIVPNHRLGGGGLALTVNVNGSTDPEETRRHVMEGIASAMPMITDAAHAKTMNKIGRPRMN